MGDEQQHEEQLRKTSLYQTLYSCFKDRFFEKNKNMKPMNNEEVLGAGVADVEGRFANTDASTLERIVGDMQVEDDNLRLKDWYGTVLDKAKQDYETELAEETDVGKNMQQAQARLAIAEGEIREAELRRADTLLHSKQRYRPKAKTNGRLGKFRQSIRT